MAVQQVSMLVSVLVIDDDPVVLHHVLAVLAHDWSEQDGVRILSAMDPAEGLEIFQRARPQIVITDLAMPGLSGMDVLERVLAIDPATDVVLMTAYYTTESAVEAIKKGACDYLNKPVSPEALCARVASLIDAVRVRWHAVDLEREMLSSGRFQEMVGHGPAMMEVFARIQRLAPHYQTALVRGATGTGKELAARALHTLNPRAKGQFVVCNCAAVSSGLFESEMFGHVKGAFTGADRDKTGLFEYANGGTLFLDEIGEIPMADQAKLLRVLQEQEVRRVGSPASRKIQVHLVAATNRDLHAMVESREFREDLYYRLTMLELQMPRLVEHLEDLPLLCRHFMERFSKQYDKEIRGLSRRALQLLSAYPWPGNVRELENCIGHACLMTDRDTIDVRDLPSSVIKRPSRSSDDEMTLSLAEVERRHAVRVLDFVGGNKTRAAEILGIGRATLYRLIGDTEDQASG
jgi:DNA-binding NtrC family response regulator